MGLSKSAENVLLNAVRSGVVPGAVALASRLGSSGGRAEATTSRQAIATPDSSSEDGSDDASEPVPRPVSFGVRRDGGPAVTGDTRYDLASLTKVVATLPSVLRLVSSGELSFDDRVGAFFSNAGWFRTPSLADATVRQLLSHTSGLPAWRTLFAEITGRRTALAAVLQTPLDQPGKVVYSDLGFMLLGALVERISGVRFDRFVRHEVFAPLGMADTRFGPLSGVPVAATEECGWRGRLLEGEVHDENATVWDGIAGHAGLFGTATDLGRYCRAWLELDPRLGSEELLVEATAEQARGEDGARRGLGWLLAFDGSFAGRKATGYGHTGFTGTSLWLEPEAESYAVLLTNRVHPHRARRQGIAELRIAFHEALRGAAQT
jgi:CubicO group peptidase (beta-lactamase class C family)